MTRPEDRGDVRHLETAQDALRARLERFEVRWAGDSNDLREIKQIVTETAKDVKDIRKLLKRRAAHFGWSVRIEPKKGSHMPLEITSTTEEQARIGVTPLSAAGKPAKIQPGSLAVTVQSGPGTALVVNDGEILSVSGTDPGDTVLVVSADADLGDGVVEVADIVTHKVSGALAANLGLGLIAVEPKP